MKVIRNNGNSLEDRTRINYNGIDERSHYGNSLEDRTRINYEGIDARPVTDNIFENEQNNTMNKEIDIFPKKDKSKTYVVELKKNDKENVKEYYDKRGNQCKETYKNGELIKSEIKKFNGTKITKFFENNDIVKKEKIYFDGGSYVEKYEKGQLIDCLDNRTVINKLTDWMQDKLLNEKTDI